MKDTRVKLLQTAAKLFAQKGYAGTSVRQIVERTGVNLSAVHYHFGDKYGLYLATVQHLMDKTSRQMFGEGAAKLSLERISAMSYDEALDALHKLLNRFVEMGFSRKNILLERIFTYAELEDSDAFRKVLLTTTSPNRAILQALVARLTGMSPKSTKLILLCYVLFSQANQSDFMRFAICNALKIKKYTPAICSQIKEIIWQNTCAILKTYEKGMNS